MTSGPAHTYSPERLAGPHWSEDKRKGQTDPILAGVEDGLLWQWADAVAHGTLGRRRRRGDEYEDLGMRPVVGKNYHSVPPVPVVILDVDRAVALALTDRERRVIWLYYVERLGARPPATLADVADAVVDDALRGDARVAAYLQIARRTAADWRHAAIHALAHFLGWTDDSDDALDAPPKVSETLHGARVSPAAPPSGSHPGGGVSLCPGGVP